MDRKELEAWLKTRRREDAILIAQRAVLRVFPIIFIDFEPTLPGIGSRFTDFSRLAPNKLINFLRLLLATGVSAIQPSRLIQFSIYEAQSSGVASDAASRAARTVTAKNPAYLAASAVASAATVDELLPLSIWYQSDADIWHETELDVQALRANVDLMSRPLWSRSVAEILDKAEQGLIDRFELDYGPISFWERWYVAALRGEWLDWDLQRDIALIPNEVWKAGPKAVTAAIAKIEAGYRSKVRAKIETFVHDNPYALLVDFDPVTRRLVARPAEACDLSDIIERIRRALRDYSTACRKAGGTNKLGEEMARVSKPAIDRLRADLRRYSDRPLDLYDEVEAASKQLLMDASASGLHKEANLLRLVDALRNRASEVAASSPLVVETLRRRAEVDLARLKSSVLSEAIVYCRDMKADSAGRFEVLSGIAIAALLDPKTPEVEKQAAYYFVKAMVPRGALVMASARDEGHEAKKPSRGKEVIEIAGNIDKLDKAVDALQENIPEATEWVTRLFTEFQSGNFFGLGG